MPQSFPPEVLFLRQLAAESDSRELGVSENVRPVRKQTTTARDVVTQIRSPQDQSIRYVDIPIPAPIPSPHFTPEFQGTLPEPTVKSTEVIWPQTVMTLCDEFSEQWQHLTGWLGTNKKIGVIGVTQNCGATTIAATIARSLAMPEKLVDYLDGNQVSHEVLLVDGNLHRPALSVFLQTSTRHCWTDWQATGLQTSEWPTDGKLRIGTLTCAILRNIGNEKIDEVGSSVSYYLPLAAAGPIVSLLTELMTKAEASGKRVIVDLGDFPFLSQTGFLEKFSTILDAVIVVGARPLDQRTVSSMIWKIRDLGIESCLLLENACTLQVATALN